jgi:hypothetical protein
MRATKQKTKTKPKEPEPVAVSPAPGPLSDVSLEAATTLYAFFNQEEMDSKRRSAIILRDVFAAGDQPLLSAIASQFAEGLAYLMGRHNDLYHTIAASNAMRDKGGAP